MQVEPGTALPDWIMCSVEAEKMKTMAALLRDPNPIHWDVEAVRRLGMGDRAINQGPVNMAYVQNMLIAWTGDASRIRSLTLRFLANVFAGERAVAGGRVIAIREEHGERLADCEVWLDVAGRARVLSGTATVAFP